MILTQTSISMSYPNENPTVQNIMHFTHSELSFHPFRIVLRSFTWVTMLLNGSRTRRRGHTAPPPALKR